MRRGARDSTPSGSVSGTVSAGTLLAQRWSWEGLFQSETRSTGVEDLGTVAWLLLHYTKDNMNRNG